MIVVHHLNNSRSQRVLWMLEELGAPYEIQRYERDPKTMLAPATLRAVHPLGKSPVIEDGGTVVAETGAIVEYLAEGFGGGMRPTDPEGKRQATYWLHFAEGSAMPPLLLKLYFSRMGEAGAAMLERADQGVAGWLALVEGTLADKPFLAGAELSVADIMMSYPVEAAMARGATGGPYPQTAAWLDRIHARPAYVRALERGGPFAIVK